jgi:diguanylate cyclase (GGDEF)-like protein/PAS domain S-box-containing protein
MERALLEANLRFGLTDQLPVLSVSDGIEALLGFKPDDFLSASISLKDRIHPHDSDIAAILFSPEIESQASAFNIRLRHADGRIRCIKATCEKETAPGGEVILDLLLQDAKSLQKTRVGDPAMALFKAMMENTGDFIFFKDRNHVFTAANEPVVPTADSGQRWPDLVGLTDYDLLPEEYADYYYRLEKEVFAGKPVASEVQAAPSRDGKGGWLDNRKYPIRDGNGEIVGLFGIARDVTERRRVEAALRESKELLQLFIEHAPAALAMFDHEMRYLAASRRWLENASITGREIIGLSHYEVHAVPERWKDAHRRGLAGETIRTKEDRFERANGSVQWLRWEVRPWRTGDGAIGGIIIFSEDITQRKQAEERLRVAASVFTHSREGILITDIDGNILDVNDTFTRITGYGREEVLGCNPRLLSSGLHGREFYAEMWRTIKETGQWSGEIWNRHKNGEIYAEMLTIDALFNEMGDTWQYVALFSDISVLKEHERKLEHVAHYDILTGLPNRALLADRLHQAMAQSRRRDQPLAVAFIDLDGFKAVNDLHGHEVGDQLLTALACRMKQALRNGDTLARLGGDEFVAVLLDMGEIDLRAHVLNRLLEAVREPTVLGDLVLQVSASLGVTFYPQARDVDADLLLRQADHAMYQAKLAGRNCFHVFDAGNDSIVRGHHEDIALIRKALAAREFVLYFQPMVNMRTGTVVGAEALIRWQLPERGLMPPAAFLPIIEDDPLAVDLGEWVIDSALTQMETWLEAGLDIPVSVNVSAIQLQQANFPDRLRALLAAHPNVKPSSLELEVLETSALQDMAQASQTIHACSEIGVSFALDDFGTGYSSLTYLKRLPSRILKIDQSFVRGILDDAEDLTIIEGVLLLALAFRRMVIAEGVESVEHGMTLLQMGCELAQGYCIARPMPAKDLPGWVASWRPDLRWTTAYRERPAKEGSNGKH